MQVLVINGSPHGDHGSTGALVDDLLGHWARRGYPLEVSTVNAASLPLGSACSGCFTCMIESEHKCPLAPIADPIAQQMLAADVVVFASPVHSLQITAAMKRFLDQFAYLIHRPAMFDGTAIVLSMGSGSGHKDPLAYVEKTLRRWGFVVSGRLGVDGYALGQPDYRNQVDAALDDIAVTAVKASRRTEHPAPTMEELIEFRTVRQVVLATAEASPADAQYWSERGWFDADYFVPVRIPWWRQMRARRSELKMKGLIEKGGARPTR